MKLRLTKWTTIEGTTRRRPIFSYENAIFSPHFRDYLEITRNYDMFFNAEISMEVDPNDSARKEFRSYGIKIYNQFQNLNYG